MPCNAPYNALEIINNCNNSCNTLQYLSHLFMITPLKHVTFQM